MIDKEYIDTEFDIVNAITESQDYKAKIIQHGKVEEARKTGQRYQAITEEDAQIILDNLDKLYEIYKRINNDALSLQSEVVMISNQFKNNIGWGDEK